MKNLQKLFSMAMLMCMAATLFSCSKDEEVIDSRDAFVGTWSETYEFTLYVGGDKYEDSGFGTMTISKGNTEGEILMVSDGDVIEARVSGNTLVIPEQIYSEQIDGQTITYDYAGNGKLVDGQLEYNITLEEEYGTMTIKGKVIASKTK